MSFQLVVKLVATIRSQGKLTNGETMANFHLPWSLRSAVMHNVGVAVELPLRSANVTGQVDELAYPLIDTVTRVLPDDTVSLGLDDRFNLVADIPESQLSVTSLPVISMRTCKARPVCRSRSPHQGPVLWS
jgi:hypothetical protein